MSFLIRRQVSPEVAQWHVLYIVKKIFIQVMLAWSGECTVMILIFPTDRSGQTVETQIRLLLEEQSDQGLHFLLFHLHLLEEIPKGLASLFEF